VSSSTTCSLSIPKYTFYFLDHLWIISGFPVTSILPVTTAPCLSEDCKHRASSSHLHCVFICYRRLSRIQIYYNCGRSSGLYVSMHPSSCTRERCCVPSRRALLSSKFGRSFIHCADPGCLYDTESSLILLQNKSIKGLLLHVPQFYIIERAALNSKLAGTVATRSKISYHG
jgi:hypothetical protein